jgi:hypothetical protein
MDKRHSCYVGPVVDDQVGQLSRRSGYRPVSRQSGRGRFTSELFRIMAVLALGLVPTDRVWGQQDTPAKAEAPQEPARPEVSSESLSTRYRFTEKYSLTDDPLKPELVNQYQVAMRGTYKTVTDKPQGAPDRSETFSRLFYTERPTKVTRIGEVTDAVRRYDSFSLKTMVPTQPAKPPYFEGLKIWYHRRPGEEPEITSLTEGRRLRELEFDQINKQLFLPQLTAIFPTTPIRVGDTWHISRESARNLVGDTPDPQDYTLDGTLVEVRKGEKGTAITAKFDIKGQFDASEKQCAVAARIHYIFEPREAAPTPVGAAASPKPAESRAKPAEKIVEARGWVSRVLMTLQAALPIPDTDDRLKETRTFELDLERRRQPASSNVAGDAKNASLSVPALAPNANEANSWLDYEDSQRRFHFRCPQELRLEPQMDPNAVGLVDRHHRESSLVFQFFPKNVIPERERQYRDPDFHRRTLYSLWEEQHWDVVKGPAGWLPEADWLPLKRKVYRIEAATKPPEAGANAQRQYRDYYLVLFTTNQMMVVWAITNEDHLKFREQAEAVIKSFQFGPSEQPESPAATQTPVPKPPL